jgi:DNA-binding transcriptional ArsR family regulator
MSEMSDWHDFTELKQMLAALSDRVRLNIIRQLALRGEITVTDLVAALDVSQPLVSWHLSILRRHGFVRTRRHGRVVHCSLDTARFAVCLRALGEVAAPQETPERPAAPHAGASDTLATPPEHVAAGGPRAGPGRGL